MGLREAVLEVVTGMETESKELQAPWGTLIGSYAKQLRIALTASEGEVQVVAPKEEIKGCSHNPKGSGLCKCPGLSTNLCPICTLCLDCGKPALNVEVNLGDLRRKPPPPPSRPYLEETFGERQAMCNGGGLDSTMVSTSNGTPIGAKTILGGEVYVYSKIGEWDYSESDTLECRKIAEQKEKGDLD